MKNLKSIFSIMIVMIFIVTTSCSSSKDLRKSEKQEKKIENTLEGQAHQLANKLESENYELCGLGVMESEIYNYLKIKMKNGSISEEAKVVAPTDNLGKRKCLTNIQSRVAQTVCDSIRFRVDEAAGGDEANQDYVDKFFSAAEHLGIVNIGAPEYSFIVCKKINKNQTEYRMFAVYSPETVNSVVKNGVKFGNDIKAYIDKGLNK